MKYLVQWSIQGHNMSDPGSYPSRTIEAEDWEELYEKINDRQEIPGYFGEPSKITEIGESFSYDDVKNYVMRQTLKRVKKEK